MFSKSFPAPTFFIFQYFPHNPPPPPKKTNPASVCDRPSICSEFTLYRSEAGDVCVRVFVLVRVFVRVRVLSDSHGSLLQKCGASIQCEVKLEKRKQIWNNLCVESLQSLPQIFFLIFFIFPFLGVYPLTTLMHIYACRG